ncbi:hypothetical protein KKC91_03415 [bacterium]|nr:hypothetical protein [bacterium]
MKRKVRYIIFSGLLSLIISFFYNCSVIPDSYEKELFFYEDSIKLRDSKYINMTNLIPYKETLLLKIASLYKRKTIIFNNKILIPYKTKKYSRKLKNLFVKEYYIKPVDYVLITADIVNVGKNSLKVSFPRDVRDCVTIKIGNYHRNTNDQIFILFKDSHVLSLKKSSITYLYSALIVLSLSLLLAWISKILFIRRLGTKKDDIYSKILISFLPANILFFSTYMISMTADLKLFVTSGYFYMLQMISLGITYSIFLYNCNKEIIIENIEKSYADLRKGFLPVHAFMIAVIVIITRCLRYLHSRTILFWRWLKSRSFSDKCVILFMFLLIVCTLLLIAHLEIAAEQLASIAYLALCFGVIIKLVKSVREKD